MNRTKSRRPATRNTFVSAYRGLLQSVVGLLEEARRFSARSVNAVMTATYWEIGRRIVVCEQGGKAKAEYGERLIEQLAKDLTSRFGRGFSRRNLFQIRLFYLAYRNKVQTLSAQSGQMDRAPGGARTMQIPSAQSPGVPRIFPLPWSHYVRLLAVDRSDARAFYEAEALRGGWSVRQLDRQIATLFYERTVQSRGKADMLKRRIVPSPATASRPKRKSKIRSCSNFLASKTSIPNTRWKKR